MTIKSQANTQQKVGTQMRTNNDTTQVIKTTTAAKITFKKMAVEYLDNAEMFAAIDAVVIALNELSDVAIASEIGD